MKLRPAVAALLAALAGPILPATAAEPFRLIVTDLEVPLVPNSVMVLADRLGFYERAGVEVAFVRVQQTPSAVAALRAGAGDMANVSTEAVLRLVASGQMALKAVVSPNKALPFLIASRQEIAAPRQLEGRSFAIGRPGSLDHSLSLEVMRRMGVDAGAVSFVGLGQPSVRARALAAGRIDATTMSIGTWLSMPDRTGLHVLIPHEAYFEAAPIVSKVNVVTDATLEDKRDQVRRVVRALVEASRVFAEHPDRWVEAMTEARPDVDREDLRRLANAFTESWSVNGGLSARELDATQRFIFTGPEFEESRPPDLSEWVDTSIIDEVLAENGTLLGADEPDR